ncbi:peptidoglycan recognition protein family protein [Palleronia pelagia]|uniref:Putative peptidoglycan binding domain-containing protein n=1 Tax=Palleronia pelagia TaxID=387096 RepID=A0A1H8LCD5_9RHOB|nr:N-acetylmuramoyl-L-alanine amidase [Palleronia pelagia]SEO02805.1 Putative peptidoglycan binding domain-containing protein [Palleronia pelagia]
MRWVQSSLNLIDGTALPTTGRATPATRRALRRFQASAGLIVDGIAGPETERELVAARARDGAAQSSKELDSAFRREEEEEMFLGRFWPLFGPKIIDRTDKALKSKRKGTRDLSTVYALVLHQTAFSRGNDIEKYNKVGTHYVILPDGTILQNHPDSAYLWASNGFNRGSVAVEFVGNFPNTDGKWWKGDKFGRHIPTAEQIASGRALVRHLIRTIELTHVLAHRQSSRTRANDPGPDIWKGVGQWAVDTLGLKDGGPGFKVGTGQPIPDSWRIWSR